MTKTSRHGFDTMLVLIAGIFAGVSTVLQKYGLGSDFTFSVAKIIGIATNGWFILGCLLLLISWALFLVALSYGKASVLFTLMGGTTYITLELCSIAILNEHPSIYVWLGVAVVIAGISLLGVRSYSDSGAAGADLEASD
jgi:multidrug transporter EmrE-like cation transporter